MLPPGLVCYSSTTLAHYHTKQRLACSLLSPCSWRAKRRPSANASRSSHLNGSTCHVPRETLLICTLHIPYENSSHSHLPFMLRSGIGAYDGRHWVNGRSRSECKSFSQMTMPVTNGQRTLRYDNRCHNRTRVNKRAIDNPLYFNELRCWHGDGMYMGVGKAWQRTSPFMRGSGIWV